MSQKAIRWTVIGISIVVVYFVVDVIDVQIAQLILESAAFRATLWA